jgi:recombination protein RecT
MLKNNMVEKAQKGTFGQFITSEVVKNNIQNICGSVANDFITTVVSAVSCNQQLEQCDYKSIVSAALLGQSLKLSCAPSLGQFHIVPYGGKASFQLGYKGYIQLAIRSGQYSDIDVIDVREGEYSGRSPNTGKYIFNFIVKESERVAKKVIGYMATFTYLNGFTKSVYMSVEELQAHAKKYSQAHQSFLAGRRKTSIWDSDFDSMARKTVLRQLLSRWGMLSVDLQKALVSDMGAVNQDGSIEYIDNQNKLEVPQEQLEEEEIVEVNVKQEANNQSQDITELMRFNPDVI